MKQTEQMQESLVRQGKELIKSRKVADVYTNSSEVEALCAEFGSGTDCRIGNSSIDPNEDSLLF